MKQYMIELAVSQLAESIAWYESHGLTLELQDDANGFAILNDGAAGRIALKLGDPLPSSILVHFQVGELPPGEVKESAEGYRRVILRDPDGYRICFFEL